MSDSNEPSRPAWCGKLWIYTNYDCNLRCSYCVARSSPTAPRRAIGLENVLRLVDEAVALGFDEIFFTGGEPFLLKEIYDMLAHSSARIKTCVLTNGMLFNTNKLKHLVAIRNDNLTVQVSLDGGIPEHHDAYRGKGTWKKTVEGIESLLAQDFRVRISTTETPANTGHLDQVCELHRSLGIPEHNHVVRPLAKRGYAQEGIDLELGTLTPEVTVTVNGVFWHPLSTDADMQISQQIFPLHTAVERIQQQLDEIASTGHASLMTFT